MRRYRVDSSSLSGDVVIPTSKSHTLRAILFGSLADGKSTVLNPLNSPDTAAMVAACRSFGAQISQDSDKMTINGVNGKIHHFENVIDAGNSGIVLRFCSAIGSLAKYPVVVSGDHSIRYQRPMKSLLDGLSQLGVKVHSMRGDDFAPVIIHGPITSGKAVIDGQDSQPVSALLIAAAFAEHPINIKVRDPGEKPWIALTLDWFDRLGIQYSNREFCDYRIFGKSRYKGFSYQVPGDLSTAAFPIVAALITNSELVIHQIDMKDSQGDKALIFLLQKMGARIDFDEESHSLVVRKGASLIGRHIDVNAFIDAIPILAVLSCFADGETYLYNGSVARQKECDRIHCTAVELRKLGADIEEQEDGLRIKQSKLKGCHVFSHFDHRLAMSLVLAAMAAEGETTVEGIECIAKTFPTFLADFCSIGANVKEVK